MSRTQFKNSKLYKFLLAASSDRAIFIFAISYLILSLINYNFLFSGTKIPSYCSIFIFAFGAVIFIAAVFINRIKWKSWQFILCTAFIVSFVVSAFFAREYGISGNLKGLLWCGCQMIVLGCIGGKELSNKYLLKFLKFVFIASVLVSAASALSAITGFMYYPSFIGPDSVDGGMSHGRLYGLFSDPNYGGVFVVIGIICGIFCQIKKRLNNSKNTKTPVLEVVLYVLALLINIFYVGMCGSRSALIVLVIALFVYAFLLAICFQSKRGAKKNLSARKASSLRLVAISLCFAVVSGCFVVGIVFAEDFLYEKLEPSVSAVFGGSYTDPKHSFTVQIADKIREINGLQNPYSDCKSCNNSLFSESVVSDGSISDQSVTSNSATNATTSSSANDQQFKYGEVDTDHVGILGRDESKDLSNRRTSIWKSAFEIFSKRPLIGLSNRNYLAYAKQNCPDTFIAKNNLMAMHNTTIDVAISQGLLGLLIVLAAGLFIVVTVFRNIAILLRALKQNFDKTLKVHMLIYVTLFTVFIVCAVSTCFLTDIIYVNTPNCVVFWMLFGFGTKKLNLGERLQ